MNWCERCNRQVVPSSAWAAMTPEVRAAAKDAGVRRLGGRGLCNACHTALSRAGQLDQHERIKARGATNPRRACARCGAAGALANISICADCADVTTDLREVGLWISDRQLLSA